MDQKTRLADEERELWDEVNALVGRLTPEQVERKGIGEGAWSVKDLLWHLRCWMDVAAQQLERVRAGTYEEQDWDTDPVNARFLSEGREKDLATVRAELDAARAQARREWDELPEVTAPAIEWFGESGPEHYREHLGDLRAWVDELTSGA
jgi:uncharacterized damage-inducible protein DinB